MRSGRERRIDRVKQRLLRKSMPRLIVTVILSMTVVSAFLTSFVLLWFGVMEMWLRYPIAILVAYFSFLLLLGVWLWLRRRTFDPDLDLLEDVPHDLGSSHGHVGFGGTSDFGGSEIGGTGKSGLSSSQAAMPSRNSASAGDWFGFDFDFGEGCLVVLAIVAIVGGLIASFYVIYIAPALLAEILVDGVLAAGLYRRVRRIEQQHWLSAAMRKTALPALLALVFFTVAAYLLQKAIPDAHTIGEVWTHLTNR